MKQISLIGSCGSIGRQVIDVCIRNKEKFNICAMATGSNSAMFLQQVNLIMPDYAVMANRQEGEKISKLINTKTKFAFGEEELLSVASYDKADIVVNAVTGFAGLKITLEAIKAGKTVALANKESLVVGGEVVTKLAKEKGVKIVPIDSEHSALWQALNFNTDANYKNLIITASGGPFYKLSNAELATVTVSQALAHPNWSMGKKITIDSATMLNKGYEVIEAKWLYNAPLEKIKTLIHPESIIHSMVEFEDCGIMAQLSYPDMRLPISLALSYPERLPCGLKSIDFSTMSKLTFLPLERKKFKCYDLALSSIEKGGCYPCILNGAGEVAVNAFISERIPFWAIADIIENVLVKFEYIPADNFEALLDTDKRARQLATELID